MADYSSLVHVMAERDEGPRAVRLFLDSLSPEQFAAFEKLVFSRDITLGPGKAPQPSERKVVDG